MTNLLSGASILSQRVISTGLGPSAATSLAGAQSAVKQLSTNPQKIANIGINSAFSLVSGASLQSVGASALQSITGVGFSLGPLGGGGLKGTKPVPLHTERAGSTAQGEIPYSFTQDIEFFLLRADQSAPMQSVTGNQGPSSGLSAAAQTGNNFLGKALSSPLGQLATGVAVNAALSGVAKAAGKNSLVAPLTGLAISTGLAAASGTGAFSQPAARSAGGTTSAVSNAVGTGPDVLAANQAATASNFYSAGSEKYFQNLTSASFNSNLNLGFSSGANSALAGELANKFPSISSTPALTSAIYSGKVSLGSITSNAIAAAGLGGAASLNEDATSIQNKDTIADIPKSWYFITAPQDVSWSKEGKVNTAETYGTNTPYVLYGSTGLRKLTLGNVMLEGFSDRKTVEANIVALETCMNMVIQAGYTAPYCWKVYSGGKSYGTFIITGVKVKEVMRDLRGYATRAFVDIDLQQVPDYQVNSGRDIASKAILGGVSSAVQKLLNEADKDKGSTASKNAKKSGTTPAAASTGPSASQDKASQQAQQQLPSFNTPIQSDIRLKEKIVKVGTSPSGLGIYEWNYISGGPRYRGAMAQDVLKKFPSAVTTMSNGYLGVYYSMIDVNMEVVG